MLCSVYSRIKENGPYDAIHVGAAASYPEQVMQLLDLLKSGGAMVVPQYASEAPVPKELDQQVLKPGPVS